MKRSRHTGHDVNERLRTDGEMRKRNLTEATATDIPPVDKAGSSSLPRIPPWKRALDLTVILLTFPFWLPLMAIISVGIKIVSSGPVLFRQQRIGLGGKQFRILKFRSMKVNAETYSHEEHIDHLIKSNSPMTKLDIIGDSRMIPGGRFFRAMALDELPQIFNVIRGEMSLVGPRPCTIHEFGRYQCSQGELRVRVAPGLTGFWQVHGKNRTTFSQMVAMDLHYAENASLWLDLAILFRTPTALLEQIADVKCGRKSHGESANARVDTSVAQTAKQAVN